jgi:hypothetical protein
VDSDPAAEQCYAIQALYDLGFNLRMRDEIVKRAVKAGMSKYRVHKITGLGRPTIDRILK